MKRQNVAVTVTPYYLDKSLYCVKILKLRQSSKKGLCWNVSKILSFANYRSDCIKRAMDYAALKSLIYVPDITHGSPVSQAEKAKLKLYGLLDR